jgi:hypothetical protein
VSLADVQPPPADPLVIAPGQRIPGRNRISAMLLATADAE